MSIVINGNFMTRRITGIERYARELTLSLDDILQESDDVTLITPQVAIDVPQYKKIKIQRIGYMKGIIWEQTTLRHYLKKHKNAICLNFCNVAPLFIQPGITALHDIMCKVNTSDFITLRNRLSRYWHIFQYWYTTGHEKAIITVSNFSKEEIEKYYPQAKGKIKIISSAWQHVLRYKENEDWQSKFPYLQSKNFFLSLSTRAKNKNGKWIFEVAKRNSHLTFAIAGRSYENEGSIPSNVHMLGYVSDADICALMRNCKAFIFPSLYEGFGLPPMEALALGAKIIVSDIPVMHEIYGDSAYYVDPNNVSGDLDLALREKKNINIALNRYSWSKSAKILYVLMHDDKDLGENH